LTKIQQQKLNFSDGHQIYRFREILLTWFIKNRREFPWRKSTTTKYQYIIAEILLQRTRAETVAAFFPVFFRDYPSWKKLSMANIEQLQHYLQPIGLWRRRASSIHSLAQEMRKRNGRFPHDRKEIEELPGIGQYITNAVLLFCHDEPQPLLDANMARVLERVFGPRNLSDIRYDPYLQDLALKVVSCQSAKKINWAILDLAATICLIRNPRCSICPLSNICKGTTRIFNKKMSIIKHLKDRSQT
jgi:A/G-specific adenine glycosylase